jgi:hypothetical protein
VQTTARRTHHDEARGGAVGIGRLLTVPDGPIIHAINAAWPTTHPTNPKLIVAGTDDDLWQSYLSDNSQTADTFVRTASGVTRA